MADRLYFLNLKMIQPKGQTYAMSFDSRNSQSSHNKPTFAEIGLVNEDADEAEQEIGIFTTAYKSAMPSMMPFLRDTIMKDRSNKIDDRTLEPMHFYSITCGMEMTWCISDKEYEIFLTNEMPDGAIPLVAVAHRLERQNHIHIFLNVRGARSSYNTLNFGAGP